MTKTDLIKALEPMDDDKVVILRYDGGWSNIEDVIEEQCEIAITPELYPVFSDN